MIIIIDVSNHDKQVSNEQVIHLRQRTIFGQLTLSAHILCGLCLLYLDHIIIFFKLNCKQIIMGLQKRFFLVNQRIIILNNVL